MLKPSFRYVLFSRNFLHTFSVALGVSVIALIALGFVFAPGAEAKGRPAPPAPAPTEPGPRAWHAMSGDGSESQHGIYLYGGTYINDGGTSSLLGDFWFYDLKTFAWRTVKPTGKTKPGGKVHASFSCGPAECVLAQGWPSNRKGSGTDTWIFSKATSSWSELNCTTALCPGPRRIAAIAFDFDRDRGYHVLFGGEGRRTMDFLGDTYTFKDGAWTQHFPTDAPSPRFAAAMAFIPTLGKVVLFGGQIAYDENPNACDMWAWDGNNWQEITQSGGPCLAAHSMAWDTSTATPRLLVMGGYKRWNYMERNPDVWTFTFSANGKSGSWTMHSPQSLACSYATPYVGEGEPFYPGSKMAADGKKVFFGGEENLDNGAVEYAGLIVCD